MKVELHGAEGGAPVALLSERALLEFRTEAEVRGLLRVFSHDPANMQSLREVLAFEGGGYEVAGLSDTQVIDRMAPIIARSCVGMVRTELLPVRPVQLAGAGQAFENPEPIFDSLVEAENEIEEPLPEPVIPPVFPVVAAQEASSILGESRLYKLVLDMLRYIGLASNGESELAKEYPKESNKSGEAIGVLTATFGAQIDPLSSTSPLKNAPSETVQALEKVNGDQRKVIEQATGGAAGAIAALLEGARDAPAPGEVGPTLKSESERQGGRIVDGADAVGKSLGDLLQGDGNDPAPSTLGETFRESSQKQGKSLTDGAEKQKETLDGLAAPAPQDDEKPQSTVADTLTEVGGGQGERLGGSVQTAVGGLTELLGRPAADVRALDKPGWSLEPKPNTSTRLTTIPEAGVFLTAKSDGSQKLVFTVRAQPEGGGEREIAELTPTQEDGFAVAHWAPGEQADPVYFEARTEDGMVRIATEPAAVGPEAVTAPADEAAEASDSAVQAAGFTQNPVDPRQGVLESVAPGPIYFAVALSAAAMVKVNVLDAAAGPDADGNPPKPLTRFVAPTTADGVLIVPYNLARLPSSVRRVKIEVRLDRDPKVVFDAEFPVVRRLAFGDANLVVDPTVPELPAG